MKPLAAAVDVQAQPGVRACGQTQVGRRPGVQALHKLSDERFGHDFARIGPQIGVGVGNIPVVPYLMCGRVRMGIVEMGLESGAQSLRASEKVLSDHGGMLHGCQVPLLLLVSGEPVSLAESVSFMVPASRLATAMWVFQADSSLTKLAGRRRFAEYGRRRATARSAEKDPKEGLSAHPVNPRGERVRGVFVRVARILLM
jgi:hypothetical protein